MEAGDISPPPARGSVPQKTVLVPLFGRKAPCCHRGPSLVRTFLDLSVEVGLAFAVRMGSGVSANCKKAGLLCFGVGSVAKGPTQRKCFHDNDY